MVPSHVTLSLPFRISRARAVHPQSSPRDLGLLPSAFHPERPRLARANGPPPMPSPGMPRGSRYPSPPPWARATLSHARSPRVTRAHSRLSLHSRCLQRTNLISLTNAACLTHIVWPPRCISWSRRVAITTRAHFHTGITVSSLEGTIFRLACFSDHSTFAPDFRAKDVDSSAQMSHVSPTSIVLYSK